MNEVIAVTAVLVDLAFTILFSRLGKGGLYVSICLNLLFVSIFGVKLITVFGLTTNTGTLFYPIVFVALSLLLEKGSLVNARQAVRISFVTLILFTLMSQFAIRLSPHTESSIISGNFASVFTFTPRITLASLTAYVASAYLFTEIYTKLKQLSKLFFVRYTLANIAVQLVDSTIFYLIAFHGTISPGLVWQTLVTGFLMKIFIVEVGIGVLYMNNFVTADFEK